MSRLLTDEFISQYKNKKVNMTNLGQFIFYRTYSRFLPEKGRREYWWETVRRAVEYNCSLAPTTRQEAEDLYDNMFHLRQFLSGRTIWVGGTPVANKYPMANYNCAFQVIDDIDSFSELLYLLLLGAGVGVRVMKDDVSKLPSLRTNYELVNKTYEEIPKADRFEHTSLYVRNEVAKITVGDSKDGWVDAMRYYFKLLHDKQYMNITTIVIDYDHIRPEGEKLKTFGGTASGYGALRDMFVKIDRIITGYKNVGKTIKLKPIDCLDICNIIGEGVVVGGVRRTAEIVMFDSDDRDCIEAKNDLYKNVEGQWIVNNDVIHRSMSNNSIFYTKKPSREQLHWQLEKMRYSGEPAFINAEAGMKRRPDFKGVNPCAEILLDNRGMCNLTTLNVMSFVYKEPIEITTYSDEHKKYIEGCEYKLDLTRLLYAQKLSVRASYRMTMVELELAKWNSTQQKDKLLGCSLTGWQDMVNAVGLDRDEQRYILEKLREVAHKVAKDYAKTMGQNEPLLITTVKPEGTLSQLPTVSSGVHYSHSPYYIRRIRVNANDPIVKACEELGYPIKPEVGQDIGTCKTKVVEFPVKAPRGKTKYDVSAIEQLENYKMFMENYVDHNTSITVHVREDEWVEVEEWLWDNWDSVVAISFVSLDDNFYDLLPYEETTREDYENRVSKMKTFDPRLISKYETDELFELIDDDCSTGVCPIR